MRHPLILLLALLPLAGCACIRQVAPDSASVVVTHVSHISQHWPLAGWLDCRTTNYGYQTASLQAQWRHGRWWWSVSDGYLLPDGWLPGPHEVFAASAGYTFWRKP